MPGSRVLPRVGVDLGIGVGLVGPLVSFLRHPLGLPEAGAELARRLSRRERDFLALAQDAIYGKPDSIYHRLLRHAGCEQGDLGRLVEREGLDEALRRLHRQGVYLTVDEGKGRRPVIRGSLTVPPLPDMLSWSAAAGHRGFGPSRAPLSARVRPPSRPASI